MKHKKFLTLATASAAAIAVTATAALAKNDDTQDIDGTVNEIAKLDNALHSGCAQPANRDFHSVLSAYDGTSGDDYKFSGCGSAI